MPRRAYSYRRVSRPSQDTDDKDGLRRQEDYARRRCDKEGWVLDDTLKFTDRRSGFHGLHRQGRGQLKVCLELIHSRRIAAGSVLIIENIDRLSREGLDEAQEVFRGILRAGVWIATETPETVYTRKHLGDLVGTIEPLLYMYAAWIDSYKKSERMTAKYARRRAELHEGKVMPGPLPGWIERTPEGGFALRAGAEGTLRKMWALSVEEDLGVHSLADWLESHRAEYPCFRRRQTRHGQSWTYNYVHHILRSRALLGEYQPCIGPGGYGRSQTTGAPIPDYYPRVFTDDEWRRLQASIKGRGHARGRRAVSEGNLFTGLLTEVRTGSPLNLQSNHGFRRKGERVRYVYLNIAARDRLGLPARVVYPPFEEAVLFTVARLTMRDVLPPDATRDAREERIRALTNQAVALGHRASEIQAQIADPQARAVDMLTPLWVQLTEQQREVEAELELLKWESLTGRGEALGEAQSLLEVLARVQGTPEEPEYRRRARAALGWLVEGIWVLVQPIRPRVQVVHAQIYLRGGAKPLYLRYAHPAEKVCPEEVWDLTGADFRLGDLPPHVERGA